MGIILASKSPRRRELLKMAGFPDFRILPAEGVETAPPSLSPEDTVCHISLEKCREVQAKAARDDLIIAADTLVYSVGRPLGKPRNQMDAVDMLLSLAGKKHTVYTGIALALQNETICDFEATDVYFRDITPAEAWAYAGTGEPMDKAGAYGAQGMGSLFIRRIEGDFYNVVGLPLCKTISMLSELGVRPDWLKC